MQSPINLEINKEWNQVPTDGTKCQACDTLIIGDMFQMVIFVDYEPVITGIKICAECYSLIDHDTGGEE